MMEPIADAIAKFIEVDTSLKVSAKVFGAEVLSIEVSGPRDEDKDLAPEFSVAVSAAGMHIFDGEVELPVEVVAAGGVGLVEQVLDFLKSKGISIPDFN